MEKAKVEAGRLEGEAPESRSGLKPFTATLKPHTFCPSTLSLNLNLPLGLSSQTSNLKRSVSQPEPQPLP